MSEKSLQTPSVLSAAYWRQAARNLGNPRMLALAAVVVALRAVCKMIEIPLGPSLNLNVAAVFNAVGAMVYGPVVGVAGALVSDPLGYLLSPDGPYFLPYALSDMSSSFIFGLFFWQRTPTVSRTLWAKFTVNMVSNVVITSLVTKWYYAFLHMDKAYSLITLVRVGKNLTLFPLEAVLIAVVMGAVSPALFRMRLLPQKPHMKLTARHYVLIGVLTAVAIGLVVFYVLFLKDWLSAHNIKFL